MNIFTFEQARPYLENKLVALRVDVNSPFNAGKFTATARLLSAAQTIDQLCDAGARVVVMSHNGRDGEKGFVGNHQIAQLLQANGNSKIRYEGNTYHMAKDKLTDEALTWIRDIPSGQAFLLQNIRYLSGESKELPPEQHAATLFMQQMKAAGIDAFVMDAYSAAHRAHRSITGWTDVPNIAGPVAAREIDAVAKLVESFEDTSIKRVFAFGGMKIDDYLPLIYKAAREGIADKILPGGMLANLLFEALGDSVLGSEVHKLLGNKGFLTGDDGEDPSLVMQMKEVLALKPDLFVVPKDFAYLIGGEGQKGERKEYTLSQLRRATRMTSQLTQWDIGSRTAEEYATFIKGADAAFFKGPMGNVDFEHPKRGHLFAKGSQVVIGAMQDPHVYSVVGGGDSTAMLGKLRLRGTQEGYKLNHVSLAGGALLLALAGEELPGITALHTSYEKFGRNLPF